jgi:hypothetical protein
LLSALADFGFGSLGLTVGDFTSPGRIVQLGVAPNRIDLLTAIDGVVFGDAWAHRVPGPFGTVTVDYIGLADLIRNKQTSARPQDLLDVDDLTSEGEASDSVKLCASVNAVTIRTRRRNVPPRSRRPMRKSTWSGPIRMCRAPAGMNRPTTATTP